MKVYLEKVFGDKCLFLNNALAPVGQKGVQQVCAVEMAQKHVFNTVSSALSCRWFPDNAFFRFISGNLSCLEVSPEIAPFSSAAPVDA